MKTKMIMMPAIAAHGITVRKHRLCGFSKFDCTPAGGGIAGIRVLILAREIEVAAWEKQLCYAASLVGPLFDSIRYMNPEVHLDKWICSQTMALD